MKYLVIIEKSHDVAEDMCSLILEKTEVKKTRRYLEGLFLKTGTKCASPQSCETVPWSLEYWYSLASTVLVPQQPALK